MGCPDSSPNRHATAHWQARVHPVVRSCEPGEDWWWCCADELVVLQVPGAGPAPSYDPSSA